MVQCEIAQDRSGVNYGIVVFSGIMGDIWENCYLVNLPSLYKVNPIHQGCETTFGQTPFDLGNPDRDIKKKSKGFWMERWKTESQMILQTRISK